MITYSNLNNKSSQGYYATYIKLVCARTLYEFLNYNNNKNAFLLK